MIDFLHVLEKVLDAAGSQGYTLDPADITRAAKELEDAQAFLAEHGLQQGDHAAGSFGPSELGQEMRFQHHRVYGIMSRALDTVAEDLGAFADGILAAAKEAERTDADAESFLHQLTAKVTTSDLHQHGGGMLPQGDAPGHRGDNPGDNHVG